jgi:hypothetical protein
MPVSSPGSRAWCTRREVVRTKSTAAGETGDTGGAGRSGGAEIRLGKGRSSHDHPGSWRRRLSSTSSSRAPAAASRRWAAPPQRSALVQARHVHTTCTTTTLQPGATTTESKKVESGACATLGKEELVGKEDALWVGPPCSAAAPCARRSGGRWRTGPLHGVKKQREPWHGTQREEVAGLLLCSAGKKE